MIQSVLVLPDLQIPYEDKKSLKAVERFMAAYRWDGVIYLGDFLDLDVISKYNQENLREREQRRLEADFAVGGEILDRHLKILRKKNPKVKVWLIEGNHEFRMHAYIDKHPELEGLMEVPIGLDLARRGIEWIPFWSKGAVLTIGHASFIHGVYANEHHAKKHADRYGCNVFYGHVHDVQSYSKVALGNEKVFVGHSLGCLCEREQKYMRGKPSNWQQAFGVFHFQKDGFFNYYVVRIFEHKFIAPDGLLYGPR